MGHDLVFVFLRRSEIEGVPCLVFLFDCSGLVSSSVGELDLELVMACPYKLSFCNMLQFINILPLTFQIKSM